MDEAAAASLALDAAQVLKGIGEDVAQVKGQNSDVLALLGEIRDSIPSEVPSAEPLDASPSDGSDGWITEVHSSVEVPAPFFGDLMSFQYMQTVLLVFLLLAFLLNLGSTLWLAFSDKWRS